MSPLMTAPASAENTSAAAGSARASVVTRFAPERRQSNAAMMTNAPITIQSTGSCVKKRMTVSKTLSMDGLYVKTVTTEELLKGIEETIKILKIFNDIEI